MDFNNIIYMNKMILILFLFFINDVAFANLDSVAVDDFQCPAWLSNKSSLPECPDVTNNSGQNILVPETYPAAAVVVSDRGVQGNDKGFTRDVVMKALKNSGERPPLMILPVNDETFESVKKYIDDSSATESQKKLWKSVLLKVPTRGYTWQQDYMQSFVNPKTGQLVMSEVQGYGRHGDSYNKIIQELQKCNIVSGPLLTNERLQVGHMGGNIETLPSGICMLGDDHFEGNQWEEYVKQVCGGASPDKIIKAPTSWLNVGHTDEIIKVIRNKNKPAPCDFTVAVASPRKALQLLKEFSSDNFLDFTNGRGGTPQELSLRRSNEYRGLRQMCSKRLQQQQFRQKENRSSPGKAVSKLFNLAFLDLAYAGVELANIRGPEGGEPSDCNTISNAMAHFLFTQDEELKKYNLLVQEKLDALKDDVQKKLKSKNPSCDVDILELPDLFFGGRPVQKLKRKFSQMSDPEKRLVDTRFGRDSNSATEYELPSGMGLSVLPNPTNAISINDTIISPDPSNAAFKRYMSEQYKKRGLIPEYVDTFDYAHQGAGNLPCLTKQRP